MTPSTTRFRFLVAASDRKRSGGTRSLNFREAQDERESNRYHSLTAAREIALSRFLPAVNGQGFSRDVLRLRGKKLEHAVAVNLGFKRNPLLTVLERDAGPLFRSLGYGSVPRDIQKRMREEILVVCPLLGLLAPTDLVPEYRCPVGAQIPDWGSLHVFWKPIISNVLNRLCKGRVVFSFLPGRLRALWTRSRRPQEVVNVRFARRGPDGSLLAESAGSGRVAGEMIRHILVNGITDADQLKDHRTSAGHVFSFVHSVSREGERNLVFVR